MEEYITSLLARQIAEGDIIKTNQEQIKDIEKKIRESSEKNQYYCYIYYEISRIVKRNFTSRGFLIEDMSRFSNGNLFKIYW